MNNNLVNNNLANDHFPVISTFPLISVVIPTRGRPELLLSRALPSALGQSYTNFEVVVVVDGPDEATADMLTRLAAQNPLVRPLLLPKNVGGSDARNAGVQAARGEWIAFLDDDDEWMPHNLEQQLAVVQHALKTEKERWPVSVCGSVTRTTEGDEPNPPRMPDPGEPMGDYMMAKRTRRERECNFMTSAIFCSRELMLAHPFTSGLPRQQDCDWVLRTSALSDVKFHFTHQVATVWYFGETRKQISNSLHWPGSLAWILESHEKGLVTGKAMAGFINGSVAAYAKRYGDYGAFFPLTRAMIRAKPRLFEWLRFLFIWGVPTTLRTAIREFRASRKSSPPTNNVVRLSQPVQPLSIAPITHPTVQTGKFQPQHTAPEQVG